jgi:hypothetical protein
MGQLNAKKAKAPFGAPASSNWLAAPSDAAPLFLLVLHVELTAIERRLVRVALLMMLAVLLVVVVAHERAKPIPPVLELLLH